jgi:hypothetical protein
MLSMSMRTYIDTDAHSTCMAWHNMLCLSRYKAWPFPCYSLALAGAGAAATSASASASAACCLTRSNGSLLSLRSILPERKSPNCVQGGRGGTVQR